MKLKELNYENFHITEDSIEIRRYSEKQACIYLHIPEADDTIKQLNYYQRAFFKPNYIAIQKETYCETTVIAKDFLTSFYEKVGTEIEGVEFKVFKEYLSKEDKYHDARIVFNDRIRNEAIFELKRRLLNELTNFFEEINSIIRGRVPVCEYELNTEGDLVSKAEVFVNRIRFSYEILNPILTDYFTEKFHLDMNIPNLTGKESLRTLEKKASEYHSEGFFSNYGRRGCLVNYLKS